MRILIDECAPRALKKVLGDHGHECRTVQEAGWAGKKNGELLSLAETAFDALITVDTNLRYQQNLAGRKIAIVIFQSSSIRLDHLRQYFPACVRAIEKINLGKLSKSAVKSECLGGLSFSASSSWLPDYGSLMTARLRRMAQANLPLAEFVVRDTAKGCVVCQLSRG